MPLGPGRNRTSMEDPPPPRLGPRPLPLHLLAAGLTWSACRSALPLWSSGSLPSRDLQGKATPGNGELAARAVALRRSLEGADPAAFARAVEREVARRLATRAEVIEAY